MTTDGLVPFGLPHPRDLEDRRNLFRDTGGSSLVRVALWLLHILSYGLGVSVFLLGWHQPILPWSTGEDFVTVPLSGVMSL